MDWKSHSVFIQPGRCVLLALLAAFVLRCGDLQASLVSLSTSTATGTADRVNNNDFIGILDGTTPTTIGGLNVGFTSIPNGETFQEGDIVGKDVNATSGGRSWVYELALPTNAATGTGFENIFFDGHAFERNNNGLEGNDQLSWSLVVNGTVVDSATPGMGVDFTTFDFSLMDSGGATVNSIQVVLTVTGFNGGREWFAARGTLTATYTTVPEPGSSLAMLIMLVLAGAEYFGRYGRLINTPARRASEGPDRGSPHRA